MPKKQSIIVKSAAVKIARGKVVIRNQSLSNALVQNNASALKILRADAPGLKPQEISIDQTGKITIKNAKFASAIKAKIADGIAKNTICGFEC